MPHNKGAMRAARQSGWRATAVLCAAWLLASPATASAEIFRIFLKNGTALASFGEYARVDDRLVFTLPIGTGARAIHELVSLPVAEVDLERTERYAEAVRASQFAATRGAAEFAALSDRLSRQLAAVDGMATPAERLASADAARQELVDWASGSHGYRADEVQQLLQLFDSTIIDLRVAAGESRFAINLSATVVPPAPPRLRAAPTASQSITLALRAASVTDQAETRRALLTAAANAAARLARTDAGNALRAEVARVTALEAETDLAYRRLSADVRRRAVRAVEDGDVRAITSLRRRLSTTDRALGRRRPAIVAEIEAVLSAAADQAAEQRLVLDLWEVQRAVMADYRRQALALVAPLRALVPALTAIQDMTGPPVTTLVTATRDTGDMVTAFSTLTPLADAADAHREIGRAIERADAAVRTRHRAVAMRSLPLAYEASAAARDALAALAAVDRSLARLLEPPKAAR